MQKQQKTNRVTTAAGIGVAVGAIIAGTSLAAAQDADSRTHSLKIMGFNVWLNGIDSKMWDATQKQNGNLVYNKTMHDLLRGVAPDVLVMPELYNNDGQKLGNKSVVGAHVQNTLDILNGLPGKLGPYQKNQDWDNREGSGMIFSSGNMQGLGNDTIRITPGNGFSDVVIESRHLNYYDEPDERIGQAKQLVQAAQSRAIPTITVGDFNAGDISERGLLSVDAQILLMQNATSDFYKALSHEYLANGDQAKVRQVVQDAYGGQNIDNLSWVEWGNALDAAYKAGKETGLKDETFPVAHNQPQTMNILKKQYQLMQLDRNRELFKPSQKGDDRATWTSNGEDATNTWPSWDRVNIDHVMMSRPFAKWVQVTDNGKWSGNLSGAATLPNGDSLSDHEPVAQGLRWIGPQLETYKEGTDEKARLAWDAGAYDFAGRNKEFFLTRNNNRSDVYLGHISDENGNPILAGLTLTEKKTLLDCKSTDARFQQAIKDYCIDDHSFIGETVVTDGGTIIVDEDAALGGRAADLRLANGGLRIVGGTMHNLDREVVLHQPGWIDVADAGNLVSVDQAVRGAGSLTKLGEGTLVFSTANSYTGGTIVEKGALKSGVTGSFVNDTGYVVNGGTLDLNNFDLSMSSFSGKAGNVKLGNASLTVNQAANSRYDGSIDGSGGLTKSGEGWLILNGGNSYSGKTLVSGGGLIVGDRDHADASLASNVDVGPGAMFGGIGTIGGLTVASGGTVTPGNSIGTLSVAGDVFLNSGSTYRVDTDPDGSSDKIAASGSAALEGGNVHVEKIVGNYMPGRRHTILTANGGITGTFADLSQNMPFVDLGLAYDPHNVYLDIVRNGVSFSSIAITRNQQATAATVEALSGGNAVFDAAVLQDNEGSARRAFDQLSGELHASATTALINDSRLVRNAAYDRIRAAFDDVAAADVPVMSVGPDATAIAPADAPVMTAWGHAFGAWSETKSNGNAAGLDQSIGGFITGYDAAVAESWRLGAMAGYSQSSFDTEGRGSGSSDNYHVGVYGGGRWDALSLRSGLAYSWHSVETSRITSFSGFEDHLRADYDAETFQAFGELGYRIDTQRIAFEPFVNLTHVSVKADGFAEKGGAAALTGEGDTTDTTFTTLGLRASAPFTVGTIDAEVRGTVGWQHAYGDTTPLATLAFGGSNAFTIAGVPVAEDTGLAEAGFDFKLSEQATLGLSYTGQFGSNLTQHAVDASFVMKF